MTVDPLRSAQASPRNFGSYELMGVLGSGGMGVVYRARDPEREDEVAIKTIRAPSAAALAGIRREIHTLAQVSHPNVVEVRDAGEDHGVPWYAMELYQGATLREWMEENAPVPASEMIPIAIAISDALAALHGKGLVHRDLKPDNIILTTDNHPMLVDFGLATRFRNVVEREVLDVATPTAGTLRYMAPEQIRGHLVDARADLYALGCLLFEALTGRAVYEGDGALPVLMHLDKPPPSVREHVPTVPPRLDALVTSLLEKNPTERATYARDVTHALEDLGGERPTSLEHKSYLYRPQFVGRAEVTEELRQRIVQVRRGARRAVMIQGESGVGKTRIVVESAQRASGLGCRVITCVSSPSSDTSAPLYAFRSVLRAACDLASSGLGESQRLLSQSARLLAPYEPAMERVPGFADFPELDPLPPRAAKDRLVSAVASLVNALTEAKPLVLVIDDVQWADALSIAVMERLLTDEGPLLLLMTARSEEWHDGLRELTQAGEFTLDRLTSVTSGEMVRSMLGQDVSDALVTHVSENAEGNPFFIAEYLRTAVAEGLILRMDGTWRAESVELPLPNTIHKLVTRRLSRLSEAHLELIRVAATIGREVDPETLSRCLDQPESETFDATRALTNAQFFRDDGVLRFVHDKVREVTYATVTGDRKRALHARIANALRAQYEGRVELIEHELIRHYLAAGQSEDALRHLNAAGTRALRVGDNVTASAMFAQALDTDAEATADVAGSALRRAGWERRLADALSGLGDLDGASEHGRAALSLLGHPIPSAAPKMTLSLAANVRQRFRRRAPDRVDPELAEAALAAQRVAESHYYMFDALPMVTASLYAVNLAERAGTFPRVARTYAMLALVMGSMRMKSSARSYFDRARECAHDTGDLSSEAFAYYAEVAHWIGMASFPDADALCEIARGLATRAEDDHTLNIVEVLLGHSEFFTGRNRSAASRYEAVTTRARAIKSQQQEAWGLYAGARSLVRVGRFEEAAEQCEEARVLCKGQGDVASEIICDGVLAVARLALGDPARAKAAARSALDRMGSNVPLIFATVPGYAAVAQVLLALSQASPRDDDLRRSAAKVCKTLRRQALTFPLAAPVAQLVTGQLALAQGKTRRARSRLQSAHKLAAKHGMQWEQGVSGLLLARMGDDARASEAQALLKDIGAVWEIERYGASR